MRLVEPASGSSRLYIGRRLWQDIGEPARVTLERFGSRISIKPGDDFSVSGEVGNSIPRLSLGKATREKLGLEPGTYTAHVVAGTRTIVIGALVAGQILSTPQE